MDYRDIIKTQSKEISKLKNELQKTQLQLHKKNQYQNKNNKKNEDENEKFIERKSDTQRKIIQGSIFKKLHLEEMHYDFLLGFITLSLEKLETIDDILIMYITGKNIRESEMIFSKNFLDINTIEMVNSHFFETEQHAVIAIEDLFGTKIKNNLIKDIPCNDFIAKIFNI